MEHTKNHTFKQIENGRGIYIGFVFDLTNKVMSKGIRIKNLQLIFKDEFNESLKEKLVSIIEDNIHILEEVIGEYHYTITFHSIEIVLVDFLPEDLVKGLINLVKSI